MKKLYFTDDFSPENVQKLQDAGWLLRKASACHASDTMEACDEVGGDVPTQYQKITNDGFIPLEQFDAVALDLENTKDQLATAQGEYVAFQNNIDAMLARIEELKNVDYSKLKADELKDVLSLKGIEFKSGATKEELLALLQG